MPSRPPDADVPTLPAGLVERIFPFARTERRFLEYRPAALQPGAPAVIVLHGGGQSARRMFRQGFSPHQAWLDLAEQDGFLFLGPNGTNPATGDATGEGAHWFDLRMVWTLKSEPPDDVGFLTALAAWAVAERGVDPRRIYVAGASNGGMMAFRLLIERPDVFAAGAAFIATLPAREIALPDVARPILLALATDDPVVPWAGGLVLNRGLPLRSAVDTLGFWLEAHGLHGTAPLWRETVPDGSPDDGCRIERVAWGGSVDAAFVEFWTIRGGGHWIPTARPMTMSPEQAKLMGRRCTDLDGPTAAWGFLHRHRRP
jgi:polyhydroxybutyrate depolymerase